MPSDATPAGPLLPHRLRVVEEAITLARETATRATSPSSRAQDHLHAQLLDAAISVYANIVEGNARPTRRDGDRFLGYAWASLREYEAHLEMATTMRLLHERDTAQLRQRAHWIGRLLTALRRSWADR